MEPTSVTATLNYYHPPPPGQPEPGHGIMTAGVRRKKYNARPTEIHNLRMVENRFDLDKNAFQFVTDYPSCERRWDDDERIRERVYPEIEMLFKRQYGASHCFAMGHIIRRHSHEEDLKAIEGKADDEIVYLEAPATFAHVDQSYNGAHALLQRMVKSIPDRKLAAQIAEKAKTHRWGIINAWRPLKPVTRSPLAVCDAATVPETDLRGVAVHTPVGVYNNQEEAKGEIWQVAYNPRQRWYWVNEMQPSEVLLIKCFDSAKDGRARRAPHSAVQMPNDHGPNRESIEIRWFVFWEDMDVEGETGKEKARL